MRVQERLAWGTDYAAARELAGKTGKLVVVFLGTDGRPLSREMEEGTFAEAEVVKLAREKFVPVKASAEKLFGELVGGRGALATCVVDETGDTVSVLMGFAEGPACLAFLRKAAEGYAKLKEAREAAKDAEGYYALGELYMGLNSVRRAAECFEKTYGGGSKWSILACERQARMQIQRGRIEEARNRLGYAQKIDPQGKHTRQDRILLTWALVYAVERSYEHALAKLEEAMKKFPASDELDYMMLMAGIVQHELGSDAKAMLWLEDLLKKYPDSSWTGYARAKIDHIKNPPPDHPH